MSRGPNRMKALMKNRITMLNARFGRIPPIDPMAWKIAVMPPHQVWCPASATIPPIAAIRRARNVTLRYSERQNQVRRRATTSSWATSRATPYMLGQGSSRRASTSISPRNAITPPTVAAIVPSSDSPSLS